MKPTFDYMNTIKQSVEGSYQICDIIATRTRLHKKYRIYEKFDLALAGHSHHGQVRASFIGAVITQKEQKNIIMSIIISTVLNCTYRMDLEHLSYPYRLFNRPSIYLYRLETN